MQSFTFYIDDDRYTVPIRLSVELPDGVAVRDHAQALLNETRHYREIEVCVAGTSLFKIGRRQERGPSYERHQGAAFLEARFYLVTCGVTGRSIGGRRAGMFFVDERDLVVQEDMVYPLRRSATVNLRGAPLRTASVELDPSVA